MADLLKFTFNGHKNDGKMPYLNSKILDALELSKHIRKAEEMNKSRKFEA